MKLIIGQVSIEMTEQMGRNVDDIECIESLRETSKILDDKIGVTVEEIDDLPGVIDLEDYATWICPFYREGKKKGSQNGSH